MLVDHSLSVISVVYKKQPTRLAIVGASVRAAAQSAVRAGFDVVGADLFADADLDGACPITRIDNYPEDLVAWLATQNVDAWIYTGALENYPELVDRMASIAPLWGMSGEALRRCRDPLQLQTAFRKAGIAFPETHRDTIAVPADGVWLGKTYRHSGGVGVRRLDRDRDLDTDTYAQRFVEGRSIAALYALSPEQSVLLGVSEQLGSDDPNEWGYVGSIGPLRYDDRLAATLQAIGLCLREQLDLKGLVGVDLIFDGNTATVIEINPRFTASAEVLERACGQSTIAVLHDVITGKETDAWPTETNLVVAKWVLFAHREVIITSAFAEWSRDELMAGRFGDRPHEGESFAAGYPVCTLFAEESTEVSTRKALDIAIREAEHRLYEACDPE